MHLRVISGEFGGRKLQTPTGARTHPMSERIRSAMFNSISGDIEDAVVLDAFAGTGAVGIEALSRGADRVTFIERDRQAQRIITDNITALRLDKRTSVAKMSVATWLDVNSDQSFDYIFVDPPFYHPQLSTVKRLFSCLKIGGTMILSHSGKGEAPSGVKGIVVVDNRSYGNACLTFFRREK